MAVLLLSLMVSATANKACTLCAYQHHDGLASGFQRSDALLQLWCALPQLFEHPVVAQMVGRTVDLALHTPTGQRVEFGHVEQGNPVRLRGLCHRLGYRMV